MSVWLTTVAPALAGLFYLALGLAALARPATLLAGFGLVAEGVYGDTVRNLLLCMGVPSPWGAPPMARLARVVIPSLPHNKFQYPE